MCCVFSSTIDAGVHENIINKKKITKVIVLIMRTGFVVFDDCFCARRGMCSMRMARLMLKVELFH